MGLHPISGLNVETAEATHIKRVGKGLLHNESFGESRLPPKPSKSDSRGRLAGGGGGGLVLFRAGAAARTPVGGLNLRPEQKEGAPAFLTDSPRRQAKEGKGAGRPKSPQ